MILVFNLIGFICFLTQSFFLKHEYNFVKNFIRNISNKILILFSFVPSKNLFFFKKIVRFYKLLKDKRNVSFKAFSLTYFLLNRFWFNKQLLLNLYRINSNTNRSFNKNFNMLESKLNTYITLNEKKPAIKFLKTFKSDYSVFFRPSSFVKFYKDQTFNMYFLRKNKIFNKGRYSRNRQLYRTGVYWCIWLSVFLGYCLYFSFYRFTFNFGYQWWLIFSFGFLFVNQKMFKYNFYNLKVLFLELKKNFNWISLFLTNVWFFLKK